MSKFFFILIVPTLVLIGSLSKAQAAPTVSAQNEPPTPEFEKRIRQGDSEISPDMAFGYSSFSGVIFDGSVAYRYFFADNIAIGGILGYGYSDIEKNYRIGLSGRWYFAEVDNWAFSFTQDLIADHTRRSIPGLEKSSSGQFTGVSQLSAHYFFTPNVSLGLSLGYEYNLENNQNKGALMSRVGLGFNF